MPDTAPRTIYLKDYTLPDFLISQVELDIGIFEEYSRVQSKLHIARNPKAADPRAALLLDGEDLQLESVAIDGRALGRGAYELDNAGLAIASVPERFILETVCRVHPRDNTRLEGLYASKDGLFTQCEAQGFRHITYFIDRPDVMAKFAVTIHADRETYPVLLSNGNLAGSGSETEPRPAAGKRTRHWVKWYDPFPKPCYLFAMVAAKLDCLEDRFLTRSGRSVRLAVYVEPGKLDQCGFAMAALKKAMRWDEEVFGLEVDLEDYKIAAVGDFNMGAMENKGLNIFNTRYVLARPDIATDGDFRGIDRVVAHEYFHNWTGNRVTCRDWFQLSLKEGLTVFRDQEFGADMYSRPVERIREVRGLRAAQFPEDAGPMAHPVRPASYMEIGNFYTATVYEKGAEVVRMIHTLIGARNFRKGMDLYFARHDGHAVTCDEFVEAMADASGADLSQFRRWYDQAGTPVLEVTDEYDPERARYTLTIRQSCGATPGEAAKLPLHIPVALGLVGPDGGDLPLRFAGESVTPAASIGPCTTTVLSVRETVERFVFEDIPAKPVPSIARGFSAPVIVKFGYDGAALRHLLEHDSDPFNRWEAGQRLATEILLREAQSPRAGIAADAAAPFLEALGRVLADAPEDPAFAAEALTLPSETYLAEQVQTVDPEAIHGARFHLRQRFAVTFRRELEAIYESMGDSAPYSPDPAPAGRRALRNLCLDYLMEIDDERVRKLCLRHFEGANNMTDAVAALSALANTECAERPAALRSFYARWRGEPLVVDKWLAVQAASRLPGTLAEVKRLTAHEAFNLRNPNKVYALIRCFCANQVRFHSAGGEGYAFAADRIIELDAINPQVASRIARSFDRWKRFDSDRQAHAREALERILHTQGLSKDVLEVVTKTLA